MALSTTTLKLTEVQAELGLGATTSLSACFTEAGGSGFDPIYEGSKDRLSNFRGYSALASVTYDSISYDFSAKLAFCKGIYFKPDGTKLYLSDYGSDTVYQFALSTAWQISSGVTYTTSFDCSTEIARVSGVTFKPDGLEMYVAEDVAAKLYRYTLSTAWDVSSASHTSTEDVSAKTSSPTGIQFNNDGSKIYISDGGAFKEIPLSTVYDTTTTGTAVEYSLIGLGTNQYSSRFTSDGFTLFTCSYTDNTLEQHTLTTAWDVSTASHVAEVADFTSLETNPDALFIKGDDTKLYMAGLAADKLFQYSLSV